MNRFAPLHSRAPLIAYIDFKSPYAFAAWEPTWQLARELDIAVDWRPLVLDIPSYLGPATDDTTRAQDKAERTPGQWSQVRYSYHDARRYVALRGLTLRGTTKIWDSSLAAIGLQWAAARGPRAVRGYGNLMFERFWRREIDIEDPHAVTALLAEAGVEPADFPAYLAGAGRATLDASQRQIFAAGIFGVPSYICDGELLFGREHLPRVRWLLGGRRGPAPDIAYEGLPEQTPAPRATATEAQELRIWFDVTDPSCYLALAPTLRMLAALDLSATWLPTRGRRSREYAPLPTSAPRGERHRAWRAAYRQAELQRYADGLGLPAAANARQADALLAGSAIAWANRHGRDAGARIAGELCRGFREGGLDIGSTAAVASLIEEAGVPAEGFARYAAAEGPAALAEAEREFASFGVSALPLYVVGDEPFSGRAHLPLINSLLTHDPQYPYRFKGSQGQQG